MTADDSRFNVEGQKVMKRSLSDWLTGGGGLDHRALILVRIMVGAVFVSEGIQKFLFPAELGVGRFMKIGIPAPDFFGPFVGGVEIVFGLLILVGCLSRVAAIPLLVDMLVAILTTKIPILLQSGFWKMAHEARVDGCMTLGLLFILVSGSGSLSVDRLLIRRRSQQER